MLKKDLSILLKIQISHHLIRFVLDLAIQSFIKFNR